MKFIAKLKTIKNNMEYLEFLKKNPMDKDGKIYLPENVRGLKVSLISAPNMPDGEAVMVVNGKDFERIKPKEKK